MSLARCPGSHASLFCDWPTSPYSWVSLEPPGAMTPVDIIQNYIMLLRIKELIFLSKED